MTMVTRHQWDVNVGRVNSMQSFSRGSAWIVPIVDKSEFVFNNNTAGGNTTVNLAQNVDSSQWVSAVLVTRIFSAPTFAGTLNVVVDNSFIAEDDPGTLFAGGNVITSSNFTTGTAALTLDVKQFGTPIGPQLRVYLSYGTAALGAGKVTLGVMLVGRPA